MSDNKLRRVTLRSFRGAKSAPEEQRLGEDYWQLIGYSGAVVDSDNCLSDAWPAGLVSSSNSTSIRPR